MHYIVRILIMFACAVLYFTWMNSKAAQHSGAAIRIVFLILLFGISSIVWNYGRSGKDGDDREE